MKNSGKRFEANFQKSVPKHIHCYRFKDSTSSWDSSKTAFSIYNACDYEIFVNGSLYWLELKSHKGKSLPLGCIRPTQVKELFKASENGVTAGLLVEFSDLNRVFWLGINDYMEFITEQDRKSIPLSYFEAAGLELEVTKMAVNIKLNIEKFLEEME